MKYKFQEDETQRQIMRAHIKKNVAVADELVLSQRIKCSLLSCGSFFSRRPWPEATPTEGLTETVSYASLSSSKQLLNDVIFIWFADKKYIRMS